MQENRVYHSEDISGASFLITGGAGFIGTNIVSYLIRNNAGHVRVLDNLSNGRFENIREFEGLSNFEFIEGDICDIDTCRAAVKGMQYISHQAALGSVPRSIKDPLRTNEVNISGFVNMLTASKDEGASIKKMVYAASSSTYGDSSALPKKEAVIGAPLSPYAVTKLVNELYADVFAKVYGFETIGLRYFNVFGPKQDANNPYAAVIPLFIQAARAGEPAVINGKGDTSRDFTYVENVVQANIKALLLPPAAEKHIVMNIACGQAITLNQLWKLVTDTFAGKDIDPVYAPERTGDIKHSLADISKAGKYLGYEPLYSIKDGISLMKNYAI